MLKTVKAPKQFEPIFQKAQEYIAAYFKNKKENPSKGTIEISGERYILVRAAAMSIDFFETVKNLYKREDENEAVNVARQLLFDIAHAIGRADAKNFHQKMRLKNPLEKLSAGPFHFSHTGWALVDIFPESKPSPDENYFLIYDHTFSFESYSWLKKGKKSAFPVCVMNAGYSSGWCEESFGVTLVASEIMCKAKGDKTCRFIMGHPARMKGYIQEHFKKEPELAKKITKYEIPGFFKKKQIEEELKASQKQLEKHASKLEKSLKEAITSRQIMFSMLEDNNTVREKLEKNLQDLKQAQDMLIQSERLASIGRLVSDIAHEVNNPLMIISGRAQLSLMEDVQGDLKENLEIITEQCQRAKNITQRLLLFAKPSLGELKATNINDSIETVLSLVEHQLNLADITIIRNYAKALPNLFVDDKQIQEVFINLLNNSRDAMPRGGMIEIMTSRRYNFINIVFKDMGAGIPEENLKKIFTPFFTTKATGTGLGLSVCYGIVNAHGGTIELKSKAGKGTTVTISLPVKEGK